MSQSIRFLHAALLAISLFLFLLPSTALAGLAEGFAAYKNKDYATTMREFEPLAIQGNANAQFMLGSMYYTGQGIAQDYMEAAKWLRLAADHGHADAQYTLGAMYTFGQGVTQDKNEASKWYRLAADQGNSDAQSELARLKAEEEAKRKAEEDRRIEEAKRVEDEAKGQAEEARRKAERTFSIISWTIFAIVLTGFIALFIRRRKQMLASSINKSGNSGEIEPDFQNTVIDIPNPLDSTSPELLKSLKHSTLKSKARIPLVAALIAQILAQVTVFNSDNTFIWAWITSAALGVWATQCVSKSIKIGRFMKLFLMCLMVIPMLPLSLLLTLYFLFRTENMSRAMSPQLASGQPDGAAGDLGGRVIAGLAFVAFVVFGAELYIESLYMNARELQKKQEIASLKTKSLLNEKAISSRGTNNVLESNRERSAKTEKVNYEEKFLSVCPSFAKVTETYNKQCVMTFETFCNSLGSLEQLACLEAMKRGLENYISLSKIKENQLEKNIKQYDADIKELHEDTEQFIRELQKNISKNPNGQ